MGVDNYKWTYCSCYYECLTEESAFLILTSILTKYVGDKCIRYLSQRMSLFTICHQCRFQLDKFCSITNAFCLQLEKMLFRFF